MTPRENNSPTNNGRNRATDRRITSIRGQNTTPPKGSPGFRCCKLRSSDTLPAAWCVPRSLRFQLSFESQTVPVNQARFLRLISGTDRGLWPAAQRTVLAAAACGYGLVTAIRNTLYDCRLLPIYKAAVPVISAGNLTTGGTGKTPVVALLCQRLQQLGRHPGIISRGYRAAADGSNDEKKVLELLVPGVPHAQHPDRRLAARQLLSNNPDVIVMDDGLQHRRLHRQLNLVLLDATCPFGYDWLLPRGLLRESLRGLRRADAVLITRSSLVSPERLLQIRQRVLRYAPQLTDRILHLDFQPCSLRHADGSAEPLQTARQQPVYLMSGIGNPAAFRSTCESLGLQIRGNSWFPDHHHFSSEDLQHTRQAADAAGAALILTTLKDLVKIPPHETRFLALDIVATFPSPAHEELLLQLLRSVV